MKKILTTVMAVSLSACSGLFESDNDNYWMNNFRSYRTYPIEYYTGMTKPKTEKVTDSKTLPTHTFDRRVVVSANVGQRMVDSEIYTVKKMAINKLIANETGYVASGSRVVKLNKGDSYTPIGEILRNGEIYKVFDPTGQGNFLLVNSDGVILPKIATLYRGELFYPKQDADIEPEGLGIEPFHDERQDVSAPEQRFEIKYEGMMNDRMTFSYTEYAADKVAVTRHYVYSANDKLLDIHGVKLQITDVYPDRVEYMILD